MGTLNDLTSGDPHRIWRGACAVRTLRNSGELSELVAHIDEIRQKTKGVALGGALRPNSAHLDFALIKLEYIKKSVGCLCWLYLADGLYDPNEEESAGNVRLLNKKMKDARWVDYYEYQCVLCSSVFRVEEFDYHYPWWKWTVA